MRVAQRRSNLDPGNLAFHNLRLNFVELALVRVGVCEAGSGMPERFRLVGRESVTMGVGDCWSGSALLEG